jgi:hypothetical protein
VVGPTAICLHTYSFYWVWYNTSGGGGAKVTCIVPRNFAILVERLRSACPVAKLVPSACMHVVPGVTGPPIAYSAAVMLVWLLLLLLVLFLCNYALLLGGFVPCYRAGLL